MFSYFQESRASPVTITHGEDKLQLKMSSSSFFLLLFPRLLLLSRTSYGMKQLILPTSKNMAVSIPGKSAFPFSQNGWGHLDQHAAQAGSPTACSPGQCPDGCWAFPRRGVLQLMCNLFQCSVTLPVKKCSLMSREAPVFQCAPWLLSCHWAPLKKPGSIPYLHTAFKYLYVFLRSLPNLLLSKLVSPSSPSFSS